MPRHYSCVVFKIEGFPVARLIVMWVDHPFAISVIEGNIWGHLGSSFFEQPLNAKNFHVPCIHLPTKHGYGHGPIDKSLSYGINLA